MTPSRRFLFASFAIVVLAAPLYYAANQTKKTRRFDIGTVDRDFLARPESVSRAALMSGPVRHEDGSVEVIDFYGRITTRRTELVLPYHALDSPLQLSIRSHRFGLEGNVVLVVNGEKLGDFVFGETSYPWGGIRVVVPQEVAERGPLRIELEVQGGKSPPAHLPADTGLGIDWLEVEPMSSAASIQPDLRSYAGLYAFVLGGFLLVVLTGWSWPRAPSTLLGLVAIACGLTALYPVETAVALSRLWVVFPLAAVVHVAQRLFLPHPGDDDLGFGTRLFAAAAVVHSALLFFPNHHPPDVPQHAMQLALLSEHELTYEGLSEYSRRIGRTITEEMVTIDRDEETEESATPGDRTFRAPYPPFFFLLTYGVSRLHGDLPFVLEFTGVVLASLMLVLVFWMGRAIWSAPGVARLAATLFFLEVSVWHHVSRGHSPGVFGAFFVLLFLWYLVTFPRAVARKSGFVVLTLLTMVVALCYTVALIQLSIFFAIFVAGSFFFVHRDERSLLARSALAFALGIGGAVLVFYAPYLLDALGPSAGETVLYDRGGSFDPPASYYFLRNHLRDTVRIYRNGFTVYVLLSLVGFVFLGRSDAAPYHRRILWTGLATYALILVLKDPWFLPRIFLHTKEDLFYSAIACLVGALPLVRLSAGRLGRPLVFLLLLGLFALAVRDRSFSANTTRSQPLVGWQTIGKL